MSDHSDDTPLTEPIIIGCAYVTGAAVEVDPHVVRVVAWTTMPRMGGEMHERRITIRFAMSVEAATDFLEELRYALRERGKH